MGTARPSPLCRRKVDAAKGPGGGETRCQVASKRPLAPSGSLRPLRRWRLGRVAFTHPGPPPGAQELVTMASFSRPRHDSWAERGRAVGLDGLSSTILAVNGGVSVLPWLLRRVKNLPCNAGNPGSIPGLGRSPGEGNGNLLQYSCLENPYGQRSLAGYSPWGR